MKHNTQHYHQSGFKKRMAHFIPFVLFIGMFLCILATAVVAESPLDPEQADELEKIQTKIDKNIMAINLKRQTKNKLEADLGNINRRLKLTEINLERTKANLSRAETRKSVVERQLNENLQTVQSKTEFFEKRLVEMYKNRSLGVLSLLLDTDQKLSFVDASYYFTKLIREDTALIKDLKEEHEKLAKQKERHSQEVRRMARLKENIDYQERVLSDTKSQKEEVVGSLEEQIARMEAENEALQRSSSEITRTLQKIVKGSATYGTGRLIRPIVDSWVSSQFGFRKHPIFKRVIKHNGIDFAANRGHPIYAADSGLVVVAGQKQQFNGYGNVTVIDHGVSGKDGRRISTLYAHQHRILVKEGDRVKKGQQIGEVGSTGYSTGPHLHFEVRLDGVPVDPMDFIK